MGNTSIDIFRHTQTELFSPPLPRHMIQHVVLPNHSMIDVSVTQRNLLVEIQSAIITLLVNSKLFRNNVRLIRVVAKTLDAGLNDVALQLNKFI